MQALARQYNQNKSVAQAVALHLEQTKNQQPANPEVEAFLAQYPQIQAHAAARLRALPKEAQTNVLMRGGLGSARDPTAMLLGRIRQVDPFNTTWVPHTPGMQPFPTQSQVAAQQTMVAKIAPEPKAPQAAVKDRDDGEYDALTALAEGELMQSARMQKALTNSAAKAVPKPVLSDWRRARPQPGEEVPGSLPGALPPVPGFPPPGPPAQEPSLLPAPLLAPMPAPPNGFSRVPPAPSPPVPPPAPVAPAAPPAFPPAAPLAKPPPPAPGLASVAKTKPPPPLPGLPPMPSLSPLPSLPLTAPGASMPSAPTAPGSAAPAPPPPAPTQPTPSSLSSLSPEAAKAFTMSPELESKRSNVQSSLANLAASLLGKEAAGLFGPKEDAKAEPAEEAAPSPAEPSQPAQPSQPAPVSAPAPPVALSPEEARAAEQAAAAETAYQNFWVQRQMASLMSLYQQGHSLQQERKPAAVAAAKSQDYWEGDWRCVSCGDHQFARNRECRNCGAPRQS